MSSSIVDKIGILAVFKVESASEIGLTRRLDEEEYCKNRSLDGAILAVPVRMADRRECSDRKSVSQCRDQSRWAYNGVVFEVKKRKFR